MTGLIPPLDRGGLRDGARTMAPATLALAAWGLVTGVAMVNGGLSARVALVFSLVSYAGSAQLATTPLIVAHTPWPVVWVTSALVCLRFVIFSAATHRSFAQLPLRQRLFSSYFNGDLPFVMFTRRFGPITGQGTSVQWGFYYGSSILGFCTWHLASIAGIFVGDLAPASWGLDLAAALALVAMLIPMMAKRPAALGVFVTAVLSVVTIRFPMRLGLLASVLCGVVVAIAVDREPT